MFLIKLICLGFMVNICWAAISRTQPSTNPAFPEKCWEEETKTAYKIDEDFYPSGSCIRGSCLGDYSIEYASCGTVGGGDGCRKVAGNLNLHYPDCCPQIVCD